MRASTDGVKKAEIYREAARELELGNEAYCCHAIDRRGGSCEEFAYIFKPTLSEVKRHFPSVDWYKEDIGTAWGFFFDNGDSGRNGRILALCFMAAMVEAGDA